MILNLLIKILFVYQEICQSKSGYLISIACLNEIREYVGALNRSLLKILCTIEKSDMYLCNSDDVISDVITDFMSGQARVDSDIFCLRILFKNILDKRRRYRTTDDDSEVDPNNKQLDMSFIFNQVLRVYQDINNVIGVEITPLYKIKRAQEITKKLDIILDDFADYVSTIEQAIPQTKKDIQLFLKTVDKFLAKIQRHAMYQDRFTRFMIGRYNLYTDNMLDSSSVDC